jgi:hypothetical protein
LLLAGPTVATILVLLSSLLVMSPWLVAAKLVFLPHDAHFAEGKRPAA